MPDESEEEILARVMEKVQRASRAFRVLDAAEAIVFEETIRIELEGE